nr:MAG TPA: hypothetical protein [Caudoviricetes sp.]
MPGGTAFTRPTTSPGLIRRRRHQVFSVGLSRLAANRIR